jgi:23S rRNA pseudouridine1911/1915/1917 synthase
MSQRADILLANALPEYSRSALAKLFDMNCIKNADKILKPGDKIALGDIFEADITELKKPAELLELPVIYEDDSVIVIDKPAGIISHARGRYWDEPSVASFIRNRVKFNDANERAGIVHRLDRATSGVMICAKNSDALKYLQKQFGDRKVTKKYISIISGTIEPHRAIIDLPIGRNIKKPQTMMVIEGGKSATTEYRSIGESSKYTMLELLPKTGRTHQLRVHLKYINKPILGDILYGGEIAERLFLHASSLEIRLPGSGELQKFVSELPKAFKEKMF